MIHTGPVLINDGVGGAGIGAAAAIGVSAITSDAGDAILWGDGAGRCLGANPVANAAAGSAGKEAKARSDS